VMIDWLKKRLSGSQKESDRYIELAEAIQEFWEGHFDPEIEKIINLRSIYAADIEGQKEIVSELGGYYEYDLPDKNIPISVAFRKLELLQKDTEIPLVAPLKRLGVDAEWKPLYARRGEAYGTAFYTTDEIEPAWLDGSVLPLDGSWQVSATTPWELADGVFLTSRGRLNVNLATLSSQSLLDTVRDRIQDIKPLHIVFEGFSYHVAFEVFVSFRTETESILEASTYTRALYCANPLDGSWKLGRSALNISVDGTWQLSGDVAVGQVIPAVPERQLINCRTQTSAEVSTEFSVLAGLPDLSQEPWFQLKNNSWFSLIVVQRKLDGSWAVGADKKLDGTWLLNGFVKLNALNLGTVGLNRLENGLKIGYQAQILDGSRKIGLMPPECETWPSVKAA